MHCVLLVTPDMLTESGSIPAGLRQFWKFAGYLFRISITGNNVIIWNFMYAAVNSKIITLPGLRDKRKLLYHLDRGIWSQRIKLFFVGINLLNG